MHYKYSVLCYKFFHVFVFDRLTALAREYKFILVADDTVAGFDNIDILHKPGEYFRAVLCTIALVREII